jgi:exopolysaccharide biosynthesis polyprenyl glycosylphosphotransferase
MKKSEIIFGLAKIPVDMAAIMLAAVFAYRLRAIEDPIPGFHTPFTLDLFQPWHEYIEFSTILTIILLAIFAFNRMYAMKITASIWKEFGKIFLSTTIWLTLIIAYFFIIREFPFSRLALGYSWLLTMIFVFIGRILIKIIQKSCLHYGIGKTKVLILGETDIADIIKKEILEKNEYQLIQTEQKITSIEDLKKFIKRAKIDEIIQSKSSLHKRDIFQICRENHIIYRFIPDLVEVQQINIDISEIKNIPILTMKSTPLEGWGRVIKRTLDIFGSFIMLIIASPIMLITAILIKCTSKGPILFSKKDDGSPVMRIGQYGKKFKFFKFRTMTPNTDSLRYTELAHLNMRKNSPLVKIKNDPRVTKLGKFLRKTSIDELPQLFNVLAGNMSLVGPRPHLPEEVEKYRESDKFVLTIKPGVTGISQSQGRSNLDFDTEIRLDTYYIQNWAIWLDIKIFFKTIFALFKGYEE